MLKTLRLDDEDAVDVVIALEKAFEIKISADEAKAIFTVGEMHDLLRGKIPARDADRKCASAMAFYRIRHALCDLRADFGKSPSYDLMPLRRAYTKSFAKLLEERSGLRLPPPVFTWIGNIGRVAALGGVVGSVATITLTSLGLASWMPIGVRPGVAASLLFLGGLAVGWLLTYVDPGRLPTSCRTLGALAARSARLSYGRLIRQGADARDINLWQALVENLADFADVPADQIARETYFLQSTLKRAKAGV